MDFAKFLWLSLFILPLTYVSQKVLKASENG